MIRAIAYAPTFALKPGIAAGQPSPLWGGSIAAAERRRSGWGLYSARRKSPTPARTFRCSPTLPTRGRVEAAASGNTSRTNMHNCKCDSPGTGQPRGAQAADPGRPTAATETPDRRRSRLGRYRSDARYQRVCSGTSIGAQLGRPMSTQSWFFRIAAIDPASQMPMTISTTVHAKVTPLTAMRCQ